ncbi:MAG: protease modulator HflK, partial [Alphaproteobacteria bacterium]|nr:protease modulator HflK [Alphaproteobacteria bacterium]
MPWHDQGQGGPWGNDPSNGDPAQKPSNQSPWGNRQPPGNGPYPPNFEDLLKKGQKHFKQKLSSGGFGNNRGIIILIIGAFLIWLASGFYRVDANEQGIETVFGQYKAVTQPGLRYNWPAPIGAVETPKVTDVNRVEIGFISPGDNQNVTSMRDNKAENLMLTGDENIIDIQFVVFWQIKNAGDYLFNVKNPELTVKSVAESVMREIIGRSTFELSRTQGRGEIQSTARDMIQSILDTYQTGIFITNLQMQKVDPPQPVL